MSALEEDDKKNQQSPPLDSPLVDKQTERQEIDDREKDHPEEKEPLEEERKGTDPGSKQRGHASRHWRSTLKRSDNLGIRAKGPTMPRGVFCSAQHSHRFNLPEAYELFLGYVFHK